MIHPLLQRQLARLGLSADQPPGPDAWSRLLDTLSTTYTGAEEDRYLLERSMTISSQEMQNLHAELRRDRQQLRAVIDSLDEALIVLDRDARVELINPEVCRIFGAHAEAIERWTLDDLMGYAAGSPCLVRLLSGLRGPAGAGSAGGSCLEGQLTLADGRVVPVSVSAAPVRRTDGAQGAVLVLRDISDRQRMERELRQAQKLESVGRLAAGVAHELNTPIQFIGDNLRFVQDSAAALLATLDGRDSGQPGPAAPEDDGLDYLRTELPAALSESLDGVARVASIVRALKSLAHPGSATLAPANLNDAIANSVTLARHEYKDLADVEYRFADLPPVVCAVHELEQVFLNLVVNAAHAIADRQQTRPGRGQITISTWQDGDSAFVSVDDDGCGIPTAQLDRVFDPFFTTKAVGRGSGQGLALARNVIVEGHAGRIDVSSQPGVTTTVRIELPLKGKPIAPA